MSAFDKFLGSPLPDGFIYLLLTYLCAYLFYYGPTFLFFVWLALRSRKEKAHGMVLRRRITSLIFTVLVALAGCILVGWPAGWILQALETSFDSQLYWLLKYLCGYGFITFVILNGVLLVVALLALLVLRLFGRSNDPPSNLRGICQDLCKLNRAPCTPPSIPLPPAHKKTI